MRHMFSTYMCWRISGVSHKLGRPGIRRVRYTEGRSLERMVRAGKAEKRKEQKTGGEAELTVKREAERPEGGLGGYIIGIGILIPGIPIGGIPGILMGIPYCVGMISG
eukprot:1125317-Amorphochlora_amoeboformis.AAC.2